MPKMKQLPSITSWLKESWEATKTTWKSILSLYAIYFAIIFVLGLVIALIFAISTGLDVFLGLKSRGGIMGSIGAIELSILALIIPVVYLQASCKSSIILAVTKTKEKLRAGKLMNMGFKKAWAVVAVGIVMSFLIMGSFGLFIIPGIVVALLLQFSIFEVVVGNKKLLNALKSSYEMITQKFWEILLRIIVIIGMSILITSFLGLLAGDTPGILFALMGILLNLGLGIYITVAVVKLYQQVKATTVKKISTSITWIWVIAILGWALAFLFIKTIFSAAKFMNRNVDFSSQFEQSLSDEDKLEIQKAQELMESYGYDGDQDFNNMTEDEVTEIGKMIKNVRVDLNE